MKTSTGAPLDLGLTKCHSLQPCLAQGVYLVTYLDINTYGVDKPIDDGYVTYGSCEGHITTMRRGCGDLIYVHDKKIS